MKTRSTFFSLTVILVMLVSLVFQTAPAQAAGVGIDQDFRHSTAPGWLLQGTASLTGGGFDPDGDGWLRLTSATTNQAGSAIYNTAFSNTKGIQVSFLYATYGGSGADGFTFYLINGATVTPTVGATGGALGYSWRDDGVTLPGVTNGYVGIGFDEYGNFTNSNGDNYGIGGYASGLNPDRIAIRGPGNLLDAGGFPYLTSVPMPIETGSRASAKHVVITITPSPTQTISVTVDGVAQITDYDISGYAMPATFKMGFSAGTGSVTNYHEIRDLTVTGLNPSITGVVTSGSPSVLGNSVTFTATVTGGVAGTPAGNVAFYDGATYLGAGVLDGAGVATYATSALTAGNHTITAKYLGDSDYAISQGTVAQSVTVIPAPTITGITPNTGPTSGGTSVTITGTNLTGGAFTFGGTSATCTVALDGLSATCTSPAHTAGPVDVVVTTPGGPATSTGGFTYLPGSIPPYVFVGDCSRTYEMNDIPSGGTTNLGVDGVWLASNSAGHDETCTVHFLAPVNPIDVTLWWWASDSNEHWTLSFDGTLIYTNPALDVYMHSKGFPAGTPFTDLTIFHPYTNENGSVFTVCFAGDTNCIDFSAGSTAPTITNIAPNAGPVAGGTTVIITGTNLTGGTVTFGGLPATCTVDSATQITCTTPAHAAGPVDVVVTTPGGPATSAGGFTYVDPPTIGGIAPNSGPEAGGTSVVITGTGLTGGTVTFGGLPATCTVDVADVQITCTSPAHAAGPVDVVVTTPGGPATSAGGFTYIPQSIPSITPNSGPTGGGTAVTIVGYGFTGATSI
ncbi:MAG: IPT/TIG domain-containing protein [Chloroflexi bacterium]|nr:IPT/TIG domain-containing protein [Chloroflexota bacterium]